VGSLENGDPPVPNTLEFFPLKQTTCDIYHLVISHSHGKSPFLTGKPSIHGLFSMAILNNQRVILFKRTNPDGEMCPSYKLMGQPHLS
jgi:hypothetical protein